MTVAATTADPAQYTDPLAWCPIAYTSVNGDEHEIIFNARDAPAPYQILMPSGREGVHAGYEHGRGWAWSFAHRSPHLKLRAGELYFTGPAGEPPVLARAEEPMSVFEAAALRATRDADQ